MRYSNEHIHHRPRLDMPDHDIGPGPLSPAWACDEIPPEPADPLDRLAQQLERLRQSYILALRNAEDWGPPLVSRDQLGWLNERCAEIRAVNARLGWPHHSSTVAAWPEPALPANVLVGVRNVIPLIDEALRALPRLRRQQPEGVA